MDESAEDVVALDPLGWEWDDVRDVGWYAKLQGPVRPSGVLYCSAYSARTRRACCSLQISTWSVHSARTLRMNLSAWAFIFGACDALFKIAMFSLVKAASNAWVYRLSRPRRR